MGQLLAVHRRKLTSKKIDEVLFNKIDHLHTDLHKKTEEIKKGCERDVLLVDGHTTTGKETLEHRLVVSQ